MSDWLERLGHRLRHPLKTSVAASVALVIYQALSLRHGYWAVISAVIVMQANLGRSVSAGMTRLVGTAIGAAVGAVIFRLVGHGVEALFLAMLITMVVCSVEGLQASQRLAGVTVAIVMLLGDQSGWQAGIDRFVDVSVGIFVALAVSLLWPSRRGHRHPVRNPA